MLYGGLSQIQQGSQELATCSSTIQTGDAQQEALMNAWTQAESNLLLHTRPLQVVR